MTSKTTLPYFSLNFKEKHCIHGEEAVTEIFAQKITNLISSAFMFMDEVVREIKDDHIHTSTIKQLNETKP